MSSEPLAKDANRSLDVAVRSRSELGVISISRQFRRFRSCTGTLVLIETRTSSL